MNCQRRWPEQHLTCKPNSCFFFFGHKCLPFSLTWQVSLTCKSEFWEITKKKEKKRTKSASTWDREIEKNSIVWKVEKGKKRKEKRKTRYSTVWNLSTIKILGSNSLGTLVYWSRVLFITQFCEAWVLKM